MWFVIKSCMLWGILGQGVNISRVREGMGRYGYGWRWTLFSFLMLMASQLTICGDNSEGARVLRFYPFLTFLDISISSGVRACQGAKNGAPGGSARGYRSHRADPRVLHRSCVPASQSGGTCSIHMFLVIQVYTYIRLYL